MFVSPVPGLCRKRIIIFTCCFLQYTFVHASRSTWSYVSGDVKADKSYEDFTEEFLGYVNFGFLFVYGSAMLFIGQLGDVLGAKKFVLVGTFSTSAILFLIAILFHSEIEHRWIFILLMVLNGVTQASAWPGLLSIMNNWFSKSHKTILMGYFVACTNIGNMIGDLYCYVLIEQLELELMSAMYLAAILLFAISLVNAFLLTDSTKKEYIETFKNSRTGSLIYADHISKAGSVDINEEDFYTSLQPQHDVNYDPSRESTFSNIVPQPIKPKKRPPVTMLTAWRLPNVAMYAFAFGCVKAVFYIIAFWLPSYLKSHNVEEVAIVTSMIEVGTIPGGIMICYAGIYWDKRAMIIVPALWGGTLVMVLIYYTTATWLYVILVFLTGLLIGGAYNNISGAIVLELSNMKELKGNKKSTSTVTSVVMGYGAVFAALNQLVVKFLGDYLFLYCGFMRQLAPIIITINLQ